MGNVIKKKDIDGREVGTSVKYQSPENLIIASLFRTSESSIIWWKNNVFKYLIKCLVNSRELITPSFISTL